MSNVNSHPHGGSTQGGLKKTLGTWQLWGIAVGLVISGEYFGWSYGWAKAGTLGFLVTSAFVAAMYTTFIFSFTELTTSIPHAGGPFAYAKRAFGPVGGYIAGMATLVEFVFAPPAISLAIGAYLHIQFRAFAHHRGGGRLSHLHVAEHRRRADRRGVRAHDHAAGRVRAARIHGRRGPGIPLVELHAGRLGRRRQLSMGTFGGILGAVPFAIWFFLAIEGVAMAAEEAKNPRRSIPIAYITGILTLVVLAMGVMLFAGGVGDWKLLADINDPLPQAMKLIVGKTAAGCTC